MPAPRFLSKKSLIRLYQLRAVPIAFGAAFFALAAMLSWPCRQWRFRRSRAVSAVG